MSNLNEQKLLPVAGLLVAATIWGILWYPYRLLSDAGVSGEMSALATYVVALILTSLIFPRAWLQFSRAPIALTVVAISAGWCNISYILGILTGEVMRVLLLFYLAPLWTVPLARLILKENITGAGYVVVFLALCGAVVMLWNPSFGMPIPSNSAEWLGLSAGFTFALANVMVRQATSCGVIIKTMSVFLGVVLAALVAISLKKGIVVEDFAIVLKSAPLVVLIGIVLSAMGLVLQYGLSNVPATRAIVILLFELVVAAIASYLLAGEVMGLQDWVGGAMIVAASIFSGKTEPRNRS